jgi:hypothetical protein
MELTQQLVVQNSCCELHGDDKGDEQTKTNPCILKRMDGHLPPPSYNPLTHHTEQRYKRLKVGDE